MKPKSTQRDTVRLVRDIPELALRRGDIGNARAVSEASVTVYEVEFQPDHHGGPKRSLLMFSEQVELLALS